jgi:hypothetical protein
MKPISEDWARTIDSVTKVVTALVIIFGGGFAFYQYLDGRTAQIQTARLEVIKPVLEKRLQF